MARTPKKTIREVSEEAAEPKRTTMAVYMSDHALIKQLGALRGNLSTNDVMALPEIRAFIRNLIIQAAAKLAKEGP